jgi:hypothetical protein
LDNGAGGLLTGWQAAKSNAANIVSSPAVSHAARVMLCLIEYILSWIVGSLRVGSDSIPAGSYKSQLPWMIKEGYSVFGARFARQIDRSGFLRLKDVVFTGW